MARSRRRQDARRVFSSLGWREDLTNPACEDDQIQAWLREEQQPFAGWNFAYLKDRVTQEQLPWSYAARAAELLRASSSVVDLGTGGGERFLELREHWPSSVTVTEEYPPNLALVRERLGPLGVRVVDARLTDYDLLPFATAEFDLVLNRHSAFNAAEVGRVLAPGGTFLTQQVHGRSTEDLAAAFDAQLLWPDSTPDKYVPRLQAAGLEIVDVQEWAGKVVFKDVGALVYQLTAVPWQVPGFSVARHREHLLRLQAKLDAGKELAFTTRLYLIEAGTHDRRRPYDRRQGMTLVTSASKSAAAELADFCVAIRWSALAPDVQDRVRELVLDLLGVAIAGSRVASSTPAADVALRACGAGRSSVIGRAGATPAVWAALANGTAAHAIEMDDVTTESSLHPGVAVIPAAFALAEELDASPAAFLEAVVAGYELTMRVGNALNPASAYARGFHPTGVAGTFGAAVAASRLLDLDVERTTHALGIAGTLTSGSLEYLSDGAWTKRLNAGWAGHAGITAALLAQAGFTGPSTVFEGRLGVLHAFSDQPSAEGLLDGLGEEQLQVMRVSIKPYACCRYNHGLIDCVLQLKEEHHVEAADVDRVRLGVLSGGALLVAEPIERKRAPENVVDAQFSAPYAAAAALVFGSGGLDAYAAEHLQNPMIHELMSRTDCYRSAELDAVYPRQWPAEVDILLRDGRRLRQRIEFATGEPENPVPRPALLRKFKELTGGEGQLAERLLKLDAEPDLSWLGVALRSC